MDSLLALAPRDATKAAWWCACGSQAHTFNANSETISHRPEAAMEDWWAACDNGNCANAYGEPFGQHHSPEWLLRRPPTKAE